MSAACAAPANATTASHRDSIRFALNKFMIPLLGFRELAGIR